MSEKIIIVDENDNEIGSKNRNFVMKDDIYRVSALWITNSNGDILLAQRALTKSHDPGKWGPAVAGTVDEGESYEENIIKEAEEEIGLKNIKSCIGPKKRMRGDHNYFDQWYFLKIDKSEEEFVLQKSEVESIKWFTKEELKHELETNPDKFLKSIKDLFDEFCP
ncbi:MAG: NUDIX domain-containing protein [Patescibacteria group bacterium]|nr:NUDIX domain-containing protein [Patescibacteria group bacterium]MDD4304407.1 NUDIX domain-containing protein [Patescibacteria group bacterium]MDD4695430.1 NUDIX domain-containing protein [Patescibacteria group bacterium]